VQKKQEPSICCWAFQLYCRCIWLQ